MKAHQSQPDMPGHLKTQQNAGRGQRLHMGHFAFMRAVVQGLDTRQSWDRYLRLEGEHDDIRNVRRTIQRIRDEFAAAARRHSRHGIARLIQLDADRITESRTKLPTLEEFAIEHGLEDFSQVEQLEYYRAQLGNPPGSHSRRRRVIARQLDALRWLEELVAVPPRPLDPPSFWLHPDLAKRLEAAGLATLDALVQHINGTGYRWWAALPGVGAGKAERVVAWLRAQQPSLGLTLGTHVDLPRAQTTREHLEELVKSGPAVVPLEKFISPPGLDGAAGEFRAPRESCEIPANTDIEAVMAWVSSKAAPASSTHRSYLKEAERFLLWAVLGRTKALSSLEAADCEDYLQFLADPQPALTWCGRRGREKWSPLWRPFEGPLSDAARRHAVVVLKNMFNFLVAKRYVVANPWQHIALPAAADRRKRDLSSAQWQQLATYADSLQPTSANARLVFALQLIRETGLRLGEAVNATLDDLESEGDHVSLRVTGRAGKKRRVMLRPGLSQRLSQYLQLRGLAADPFSAENRGARLLGQAVDVNERAPWSPARLRDVDPKAGIAAGTLYGQMKSFFAACAENAAGLSKEERRQLKSASTNWLRTAAPAASAQELD